MANKSKVEAICVRLPFLVATKNTYRFELPRDADVPVRNIYVAKEALGDKPPSAVIVTVEAAPEEG